MPYIPDTDLDGLQATLGPLRLGAVDSAGVAWFLQSLEGWDSPDIRAEYTQREADHGAWASPVYYSERPITLAGTIEAADAAGLDDAMERLREADSITDTTLTVWETIPKQATVRRSGRPLLQHVTDRIATFSVMVTAEDPRRYDVNLQTGTAGLPSSSGGLSLPAAMPLSVSATVNTGSITAANPGTFAARPTFTITGPVQAPKVIVDSGAAEPATLTYSQNLASGESLVIDCDAHTAVLNGTSSRRRYLTVTTWPEIPPKLSVRIEFRAAAYDAAARLTAQWRSAWI